MKFSRFPIKVWDKFIIQKYKGCELREERKVTNIMWWKENWTKLIEFKYNWPLTITEIINIEEDEFHSITKL